MDPRQSRGGFAEQDAGTALVPIHLGRRKSTRNRVGGPSGNGWVLFACRRNLGTGASLGPQQEILSVSNTNETKRRSWVVIAVSVAVAFIVLAFGGSFYVYSPHEQDR